MERKRARRACDPPSAGKAPTLTAEQPAPAPSARKAQTFTALPPPGYVVQRRESIHVGARTAEQEEADSSANFEERTVSLTASESVQIRQFRELRFCSGCRLWDSGVALSRWLCTRGEPDLLLDKDVLELGSGVGMVGLVAARKARRVRLTDGEPRLLPNLRHNAAQAAKLVAQASARVDTAASAPTHRSPRLHRLTASFLPCAQLLLTRPGRRGGAQLELRSRRASSGARHLRRAARSRPGLLLGLRCGARPCGTRAAAPDRRHAAPVLAVGAARPAPIHGGAPLRQPRTRSQPRTKLVSA